ncbi:hypothetical protein B5F76_09080 [Desulfovibrio sp. An276]|uniref:hypothetical protein n=1 Tax=Desulfovibrio sp. An276 TaxID=1965618 RepID=UPI000B3A64F5|nr:hypothetical protein [Desulfovibrio sp. An276]OUO51626.1 hypothetical protein B5F76_09080 [Desulfovibrio sp. An276]
MLNINTAYFEDAERFAALTGLNLENKDVADFARTMELAGFTREGQEEFEGPEKAAKGYLAQGSRFFSDFRNKYEAAFVVEEEAKLADMSVDVEAVYQQLAKAVAEREGAEKIFALAHQLENLETDYKAEAKFLADFKATLAACGE